MSSFPGLQLSPWYLNTRRLNEYCGGQIPAIAQTSLSNNSAERANGMYLALNVANFILSKNRIESLISAYNKLKSDEYTTCFVWDVLNFRGVGAAFNQGRIGTVTKPATFDGEVHIGDNTVKAYGILLNDHFYSISSTILMRGRKRALILGQARLDDSNNIEIHPIIIGDMQVDIGGGFSINWSSKLRIYPQQIDAFLGMENIRHISKGNMDLMLKISENQVKGAIAEIIGEPFIPKDWGGEKSDLSTNCLQVGGVTSSAAFIFKGPGLKGPLYPSSMGKRGDQLVRAFEEPVEIVIVQHCAKIENSVVRIAEALAATPSNPKRYCILDGADTFRLLKAKGKLPQLLSK